MPYFSCAVVGALLGDALDEVLQRLACFGIDRDEGFQRTAADGGSQLRPYHVVDPRGCPGQIVHGLQEPLRVLHAPANEHVEIDVLLLAGEELGGPRIVDLHPPIDRQRRLIGQLEIEPGLVKVRTGRPNCVTMTNWVSSTNSRQRQATARTTTNKARRIGFFMVFDSLLGGFVIDAPT